MVEHVADCEGTTRLLVGRAGKSMRLPLMGYKSGGAVLKRVHGWTRREGCLPRGVRKRLLSAHRVTAGGSSSQGCLVTYCDALQIGPRVPSAAKIVL
jgi:hypothetical protein